MSAVAMAIKSVRHKSTPMASHVATSCGVEFRVAENGEPVAAFDRELCRYGGPPATARTSG
jgi:hypothetical protein